MFDSDAALIQASLPQFLKVNIYSLLKRTKATKENHGTKERDDAYFPCFQAAGFIWKVVMKQKAFHNLQLHFLQCNLTIYYCIFLKGHGKRPQRYSMSLTLKVVFFVPKEQKMLQNMLCPPKKTTTEYVVSSSPVAAVIRATEGEEGDCRATQSSHGGQKGQQNIAFYTTDSC